MTDLFLLLPVLGPLAAAALILLGRVTPDSGARWALAGAGVATVGSLALLVATAADGPVALVAESDDGRAIVGLVADRTGAVLAALTSAVALVVLSFAGRALQADPRASRFFATASVLTAATTSVALMATLAGVAAAWVVTSVALVVLLGHRAGWTASATAQRRTGATFAVGDLALLVAVVVSVVAVGDLDLRALGADAAALDTSTLHLVAVLLVVAGVCRSALIPAHRWLSSTLAAPTPVSALLHAGVINGIGVLLIRTHPLVGESAPAMALTFATGAATAVIATAVMLVRHDVKGGLVWSTAGQMGFMAVQVSVGAFAAALFHLVGHAMYKAAAFLGAGGSVSAVARSRHLPRPVETVSRPVAIALAALLPAAGIAAAFVAVDPDGSTAAKVLVATFGWLAGARLVHGWLRAAPASSSAVGLAVAGGVVAPFTYVAAITGFERFVADSAPMTAPSAVGTVPVVATIAVVALATLALFVGGSTAGRQRVFALLHGFGSSPLLGAPAVPSIDGPRLADRPALAYPRTATADLGASQ